MLSSLPEAWPRYLAQSHQTKQGCPTDACRDSFAESDSMTCVHAMSAEDVQAMLGHVFSFLLHQRPTYSARSPQSWRKSLANVCESVLADTLAALLQSGVPVLYNAHLFGPELIRCASNLIMGRCIHSSVPAVVKVNTIECMTFPPVVKLHDLISYIILHRLISTPSKYQLLSRSDFRVIPGAPCRLASSQSSSSLAVQAANVLSGLVEADAEALLEANQVQEVISIDLADSEHYCSPALWKACVCSLADPSHAGGCASQ